MSLTKRDLLKVFAALGITAAAGAPALAACLPEDALAAGEAIGKSWIDAHPDANMENLRAELLPDGLCDEALASIRRRIELDFERGALFTYKGWRLSQTEGQLFALLAAA